MPYILKFTDPGSESLAVVGGKGANLGRLTGAGFAVPQGFTLTTDAYGAALSAQNIGQGIGDISARIDFTKPDSVESQCARIRQLIADAKLPPPVCQALKSAYRELGDEVYVAVRSSGTAEDLAEASFAGLHDTFLDVRGEAALEQAVLECWTSMWSARAVAYRHEKKIDHSSARLAVVIQKMIESDVAGVMFTGNPLNTATDEIVINASFGLGESVVGGTITPDEFVINANTMKAVQKTLGSKKTRVVRDRSRANGTITEEIPQRDRDTYSLDDAQLAQLARLGVKVQDYYDGFPQDIEWALEGGQFYLLQSRPITGVEFSWDAELEETNLNNHVEDDWVWTRAWADSVHNGGITPLNYSARFTYGMAACWNDLAKCAGLDALTRMRIWKFHKGEVYYNCHWDKLWNEKMALPGPRSPQALAFVPQAWHEELMRAPFSVLQYVQMVARTFAIEPGALRLKQVMHEWRTNRHADVMGLLPEQLRELSDKEVKAYIKHQLAVEREYGNWVVVGLIGHMPTLLSIFSTMVLKWYDGDDALLTFTYLISGSRQRTATQIENHQLWALAQKIRQSAPLLELFHKNAGAAFFAACEHTEEGRAFLAEYQPFAERYSHRGHADRDIIYERRGDDPGRDYPAFQALLHVKNPVDPEEQEREVNERREATLERVLECVRRQPLGALKAEALKIVYAIVHDFIVMRDDEREYPTDAVIMSYKRGFMEVGRRLQERGYIDAASDVMFLGYPEAYELLDNHTRRLSLLRARIAARRRNYERRQNGELELPKYLQRNRSIDLDSATAPVGKDGVYAGIPTSPGVVTARARVIHRLADMGRVQDGDILVTNSTDPGWTPVFYVIKGVVVETGGVLSHASCLAREYGFPAIQCEDAMRFIPDGALIRVDGNAGTVTIVEAPAVEDAT